MREILFPKLLGIYKNKNYHSSVAQAPKMMMSMKGSYSPQEEHPEP